VDALMKYLIHYLKTNFRTQQEQRQAGSHRTDLSFAGNVQEHLRKSIHTLSKNNGLTLIMALSYEGVLRS